MVMNVSRPSLHRELKALEAQGLIRISSHEIEIPDTDALQIVLERRR
jgi:DNA-binding transcriptional regulator LsrR (DeoR family)